METTLSIIGMTCEHCENRVSSELSELSGVTAASADFRSGTATVISDAPLSTEAVIEAVEEAGYELATQ